MRRLSLCFVALLLSGCADDPIKPGGVLTLRVGPGDTILVDNWSVHSADLPALIKERQPSSVLVTGEEGSSYSDAVAWKQRLEEAGAKKVSIVAAH
jgi:biopolymer transport protein ExbD